MKETILLAYFFTSGMIDAQLNPLRAEFMRECVCSNPFPFN